MDISESILQIRQLINVSKPFNKKEKILILDALLTDDRPSDKSSINANKKIISNHNTTSNKINNNNEYKPTRGRKVDLDTKEEQKISLKVILRNNLIIVWHNVKN